MQTGPASRIALFKPRCARLAERYRLCRPTVDLCSRSTEGRDDADATLQASSLRPEYGSSVELARVVGTSGSVSGCLPGGQQRVSALDRVGFQQYHGLMAENDDLEGQQWSTDAAEVLRVRMCSRTVNFRRKIACVILVHLTGKLEKQTRQQAP